MYITFEDYLRWYDPIDQLVFDRLAMEASRVLDRHTTGVDGYRKLRNAYPEEETDVVKFTAAQLVNLLYQISEVERVASLSRGYKETENGLQRLIVSRVEAGNEAISYMESQSATTAADAAAKDKAVRDRMLSDVVRDGLSGVPDANGVNLLYMGPYPRRWSDV